MKLLRVGDAPPLHYRIGTEWGQDDIAAGDLPPNEVSRFFERWCGADFERGRELEAGREYYLQLEVAESTSEGYYEVYGTALKDYPAENLSLKYKYLPEWGEGGREADGFENSLNVDYGSRTPEYEQGHALVGNGETLADLDFAFQVGEKAAEGSREERFAFIEDELLTPLHQELMKGRRSSPSDTDEVAISSDWNLEYSQDAGDLVHAAVIDFRRFLEGELGVVVTEAPVANWNGTADGVDHAIVAARCDQLGVEGKDLKGAESFWIEVMDGRIEVCGYDDRGVMRGLQELEDRMRMERGPFLKKASGVRRPRYSPRITAAPFYATVELEYGKNAYTPELLSRISHAGFNAIWIWGDLFDLGRSNVFPELDDGVALRQQRLRELTEKAGRVGVDVYVVLAYHPLPASFFEAHPGDRGTPFKAYGGDNVLCTSTDEVRTYIREATGNLFDAAPLVKGVVFIVGGEGFIHCYTRRMDCPRCSKRSAPEVVAELAKTIEQGARASRSDADVVLWPYSATNFWSSEDPTQSRLIDRLDPGVTFMTEFGKEGLITFGKTTIPAYDYPISYLGPSERFTRQVELTRQRKIPFWIKDEHAIALEAIQTPYIPVYFRWADRYRRMREFDWPSGVFANWMHYGFTPSIAAEIMKEETWEPFKDPEELLKSIARREYGEAAVEPALGAWRDWSEAIAHYPFSGRMAMGPFQKGPAHPLFLDPEYEPLNHAGRQFKNDLSWTEPWGAEDALGELEKLEMGWQAGVVKWEAVEAAADPELKRNAVREGGVGKAFLACIRSTVNVGRFYQLRERLQAEKDRGRAEALLDQMAAIARRELENARAILPVIASDSRLGYSNSVASSSTGVSRSGIYSPGSIEKKIRQVEHLVEVELPEYRSRLDQ